MATGYDRDKYVYHSKQQLPDASAKNASSDGKHGVWKRKPRTAPSIKFPEDDDVFDNSDTDEDANFPHSRSTKPRGAGNARGDRHRGHSFRNAEDSSLWRQRSPGQGFDSSNWRIQGERQEESRKFRSSSYSKSVSSYRGSTSFAPRVSDGEELNAGSWRNTKSLQEKGNRADALESGGISRDFFRRPGRGVVKANLEEDFDIPRSEETSSVSPDGPHAASWRKTRRHSQQRQADNLDEGEVCESRTNITREFFRRPAKSVARTGRKDTKDMKTEDEDLIDSDSNSAYYSDDGLTSQQRQTFAPYLRKTEMKHEVRASSFSNYELESFLDEKSQDALLKLVSQRERCQALFSADELDENTLLLTVRVLSCMSHLDQVSDTLYTREVNVILSMLELSSFFSKHLTRYLVGLSSRQADDCDDADTDGVRSLAADIDLILDILQLFLQRKPLACSEVSVVLVLLQKVVTTAAVNNVDFDPQGYRMAKAYRHVLLGLQQMNEENFPFRKYIVDVAKQVQPPQYLKVDEEVTYDLRPLLTCSDEKSNSNNLEAKQIVAAAYVPILDSESWPNAEVLHLDDSQKDALQTALTREFAIIQGPPGTGKTYIGLKIVELLLYNTPWSNNQTEEVKTSPILVVCYTNHALDQFLEGIMDFGEQKVVRVGNRSSSEKLENKSLSRLRKQRPSKEYREEKSRLQQMSKELAQLDEAIQRTLLKLDLPNKAIIDVMALRDLMSPGNFRDLSSKVPQMKEKSIEKSSNLMLWLEVGDGSTEQSQGEVADPEQNPSGTTDDTKEFMEVDDEGAEIQRERQFDDSEDFVEDRDQRRKTLESKIFYEDAAHSSEHTLDSKSVAEMEKSDTMTGHEAAKTRRIWKLKLHDRWRLYRLWIKLYKEKHGAELSGLRQRYMALSEAIETLKAQEDLEILRKANVIGMTTTGAARCRNVLQLLGPLVVVIEEAAEVLEAHIITTLTAKCQHLILIGDHQQLKPNPTVYRLAKLFNLDTSLFERMINNGMPCNSLSLQHRMRPEISELMKKHFYKRLQDDESVLNMGNIPGVQNNMFFLNHRRLEDGLDDNRTRSNQHEAEVLVGLCKYLLDQGYQRSQVTILTTYKGQMFCIKRLMDRATFDGVRVTVVDNFQGEENDIILLSLVRSNEEGSIGFLRTSNRVCVALSRARMGFYCIGNFTILKKAPVWHDIISTMEAQNKIDWSLPLVCQNHPNKISQVTTAKDFKEKVPCGGCDKSCDYSLLCGHVCHLSCHPYDPNHLDYKCHRPCNRYCERGEHKCLLECYQKCNPCQEKVQKLMPGCGHGIQVSCCQFDTVSCPEPCPKLFANCGHPCRKKCGELCSMTCPEKCEKSLGCGHPCLGLCGLPCDTYCKVQVERTLEKCGHKVFMDCSQIEISCPKPCLRRFEGCKHLCRKKCGDRCPEVCPEKCERKLACGHPCKELCSEICTQYCLVKIKRILPTCGHEVVMDCDKDLDDIECNARVKKAHPVCGHYVVVACCEDPEQVQCKMSVIKRRKCGHLKAMSCFIDPDSKECTERCDKILCCGHQCPNKCGKPCTVSGDTNSKITFNLEMFGIKLCEVDVEKTYPSCSHVVKLPCHKDVSQVPCTSTCGKLLVCGHRCPKKCSQPCPRDNLSSTFMTLYVEHGMGFSSFCREKCGKFLPCGHACPNRCGEPCPSVALANISSVRFSTKCKQLVEKTLPGCGHTAKVECFKDVSLLSCSEICGKKLSCGHVCQNKCGMPCKCFRSVLKKLPNCRHFTQLPCHQDPSSYECKEHCQRKLICGHQCPNKCSEPCPGEEDSLTDEDEPGSSLGLSGTRIPARRCTEIVRKEFIECYHSVDLPCYKDISTVRCKERCEEILPCGHQCPNTCSNCVEEDAFSSEDEEAKHRPLYTKCKVNVQKILPCGHSQEVACWLQNSTKPCLVSCTAILSCGHTCSGNCDDCHEGRQHVTCTGKCKRQLLCGHSCRDICGRDCPSDCKSCTDEYKVRPSLLCRRELRGRDLKTFPCPHGITNRQLKSKACILRCAHKRSCRHECVGVCGEPCPPYCSVCDKYLYKDNLLNKHIRQKETFIYLPDCGHLCETRLLDKIAACFLKPVKNGCYEIRSLVCPKCKEPVLNCPRYDDILHIIKKSVEAAKLKCDQARKDSPTGRLSRVYRSLGNKSATPTWSFAVGRWLRCPRGHVFYLENGQQEGSNGPVCPECSKE
ncbi:uncharacterized protein LOC110985763 [Acanthaster planci]|uniref:Uncharacterized protein LOC110985763 n=1 Tax=Acanthaster planci TaxID=133434 RepID=A0A8B7ZAP4_ACAPL|nr:uncharacterized protein LOC110985763 [Acanthaster planci]